MAVAAVKGCCARQLTRVAEPAAGRPARRLLQHRPTLARPPTRPGAGPSPTAREHHADAEPHQERRHQHPQDGDRDGDRGKHHPGEDQVAARFLAGDVDQGSALTIGLALDAVEHAGAVVQDVDGTIALAMAAMPNLPGNRGPHSFDGPVRWQRKLGLRRVTSHGRPRRAGHGCRPTRPLDQRLPQFLGRDASLGCRFAQLVLREFRPLVHGWGQG